MSGTVSFTTIDPNDPVPGVNIEINDSGSNVGTIVQNTLICGQMLSAGTATPNVPVIYTGASDSNALFGTGSHLAAILAEYRLNDTNGTIYCLPVIDNSAGTAGTSAVTLSGTATATGTLTLYVNGAVIQTTVNVGDIATVVANNVVAQMQNQPLLPVTAAASSGTVTFTARHKGIEAGEIVVVSNYLGATNGERTPAGITVGTPVVTAGTANPDFTTAFSNLADQPFDFIVFPYTAPGSVTELETLLTSRWGATEQLFGVAYTAVNADFADAVTLGSANNYQYLSVAVVDGQPKPAYLVAAVHCATNAIGLRANPSVPTNTTAMKSLLAPPIQARFTRTQRKTLLQSGISTYTVNANGNVQIERAVTTYKQDANGATTNAWRNINVPYQLMLAARTINQTLSAQYAQMILVADGTRIPGAGSQMATSQTVLASAIAVYRQLANTGLVQNVTQFVQNAYAVNAGNGVVDLYLPIQLSNQLEVINIRIDFSQP